MSAPIPVSKWSDVAIAHRARAYKLLLERADEATSQADAYRNGEVALDDDDDITKLIDEADDEARAYWLAAELLASHS
jgi:hypothetical protein